MFQTRKHKRNTKKHLNIAYCPREFVKFIFSIHGICIQPTYVLLFKLHFYSMSSTSNLSFSIVHLTSIWLVFSSIRISKLIPSKGSLYFSACPFFSLYMLYRSFNFNLFFQLGFVFRFSFAFVCLNFFNLYVTDIFLSVHLSDF